MFCSQIAPWHGPNPKQIEPWTVWEKWIILLDKLFLEDNEVLVKQDLRKKNSIFSAFLRDYCKFYRRLYSGGHKLAPNIQWNPVNTDTQGDMP